MELLKSILIKTLEKQKTIITFPDLNINAAELLERESYKNLEKIKAIIENDSLSDFDCVEEIVRVFEDLGSNGGSRHDF